MLDELRRGLETAYIDGSVVSNESLRLNLYPTIIKKVRRCSHP